MPHGKKLLGYIQHRRFELIEGNQVIDEGNANFSDTNYALHFCVVDPHMRQCVLFVLHLHILIIYKSLSNSNTYIFNAVMHVHASRC